MRLTEEIRVDLDAPGVVGFLVDGRRVDLNECPVCFAVFRRENAQDHADWHGELEVLDLLELALDQTRRPL